MGWKVALVTLLLGLVGCGAEQSDAGDGNGTKFGVALPELELWGYLRTDSTGLATEAVLGPVSFAAIRDSTDRTHALIHVSGFT
jgi:hypothetical protein